MYAFFRKHLVFSKILHKFRVLSEHRYCKIKKLDPEIIRWDLRRGIPFEENTFHAIYCSQFIEHLTKEKLSFLLHESYRVLVLGGLMRIVTPDLEHMMCDYVQALNGVKIRGEDQESWQSYDSAMSRLFEQMTRERSVGASKQPFPVRILENLILGGPEKRGEKHKWLYDFYSLERVLKASCFKEVVKKKCGESVIDNFEGYGFEDCGTYPDLNGNLYVEAFK